MRLLLLSSPSTKGGAKRMMDFLCPEIHVDFALKHPDNMAKYDGVILHNFVDARPGEPTAIYPCGRPTARMMENPEYLERALSGKPRAIWNYSHTPQAVFSAMPYKGGLLSDVVRLSYMPKPFPFTIPDRCPPMPNDKRILWYWRKDWMHTKDMDEQIKGLMKEVADAGVEIWVISNKRKPEEHEPIVHPNVRPMGRIDFPERLHEVSGMVRITDGLDYGRSTYQILAYGRWCIYVGLQEPHVVNAGSAARVPELIAAYVNEQNGWLAEEKRKYIAENFSDAALRKHWQAEVMDLFGK